MFFCLILTKGSHANLCDCDLRGRFTRRLQEESHTGIVRALEQCPGYRSCPWAGWRCRGECGWRRWQRWCRASGSWAVQSKAVDANMMKQIHTYIEYASGASGKMPSTQETVAALQLEAPAIAALVNDGTIVLNPVRSREEVWAYEKKAYESRGWVATSQGVETMDAATLKSRLGQ